jgi:hypothetical protein
LLAAAAAFLRAFGDGARNRTAMIEALRTPDDAFAAVPNFAYAPHYFDDLRGFPQIGSFTTQ